MGKGFEKGHNKQGRNKQPGKADKDREENQSETKWITKQ